MRPGREIDTRIAEEVFGHQVFTKNTILHERTPLGERPLRYYTQNMEHAWQVAEKMRVCLIPIEGGQWFGFIGPQDGWQSPTVLFEYLKGNQFAECGAAVGENAAEVICAAALRTLEKRQNEMSSAPDNVVLLPEDRH